MRGWILFLGIGFLASTQAELLHSYTFEGASPYADSTGSADLTEYGSQGTITNQDGFISFSGTINSSDTVYLGSDALTASSNQFIISIWFQTSNTTNQSDYSSIFSSNAGTDAGFQIHFFNGFFGVNMNGTKLEVLPLTDLTANEWHLVTIMQDPSATPQGQIWLDGTVYDSDPGSFGALNTFRLGVNRNGKRGFEGDLADVRIYDDETWDSTRQTNAFIAGPPSVYDLNIASLYGTTVPVLGTHSFDEGTVTNLSVSSPVDNGTTQYVCTGWTLAGQEPASGTGSSFALTVTNNAALTWTWGTNYWVEALAGADGSIASPGWIAAGTTIDIIPNADTYYEFAGWTGDASGTDNPLQLLVDGPKSVTATYTETLTANTGTPHWWLAQIDPNYTNDFEAAATDNFEGDDFPNWEEYLAKLDPTVIDTRDILNVVDDPAGRLMSWHGSSERQYAILWGTDIIGGGITNILVENLTPPVSGIMSYTNSAPTSDRTVFYRLVVKIP